MKQFQAVQLSFLATNWVEFLASFLSFRCPSMFTHVLNPDQILLSCCRRATCLAVKHLLAHFLSRMLLKFIYWLITLKSIFRAKTKENRRFHFLKSFRMEDEKEKEKNIFQENVEFEKEIVWAFLCHIVHKNDSSSWDGKSEKERKKGRKKFWNKWG